MITFPELPLSKHNPHDTPATPECLNTVFHDIEGMNRRRAFISTKYVLAHEQFDRTLSDADKLEIERYKTELENIDSQAAPMYKKLRDIQSLYLVEYEGDDPTTRLNCGFLVFFFHNTAS